MARSRRQTFRIVCFKEGEVWSAQCLEFDIATQAKTPRKLAFAIQRAIAGQVLVALQNRMTPFKGLPPAPKRFWRMFESGVRLAPEEFRIEIQGIKSSAEARVAEVV